MLWITDLKGTSDDEGNDKKYRGSLISSILVILAGVLVGFTSTHGKWINVFFVVTHCIFVAIIFYDNRSRQQSPKVIGMTIWMIPVITLLYNALPDW